MTIITELRWPRGRRLIPVWCGYNRDGYLSSTDFVFLLLSCCYYDWLRGSEGNYLTEIRVESRGCNRNPLWWAHRNGIQLKFKLKQTNSLISPLRFPTANAMRKKRLWSRLTEVDVGDDIEKAKKYASNWGNSHIKSNDRPFFPWGSPVAPSQSDYLEHSWCTFYGWSGSLNC